MKQVLLFSSAAVIVIAAIVAFAYLHVGDLAVLNPHGAIAVQEQGVILITLALCSIIVIPVFLFLFIFAWKYRANNPKAKMEHEPNWDHDSWLAEFLWWLGPTVIVGFLAVIIWQTTQQLDPYVPIKSSVPPITVQVVALDWKWLFIYPDQHIATVNMLEIPVNTPVHFEITADAPMNSFWIPSLGGQIMAMPGMTNQLYLIANTAGTYKGVSGNISGEGFAGMSFPAKAVSRADFNAWVAEVAQVSTPLTPAAYASLVKPSEYVPPAYYSLPDQSVYTSVIMKYMMSSMPRAGGAPMQSAAMPNMQDMQGMDMGTQTNMTN